MGNPAGFLQPGPVRHSRPPVLPGRNVLHNDAAGDALRARVVHGPGHHGGGGHAVDVPGHPRHTGNVTGLASNAETFGGVGSLPDGDHRGRTCSELFRIGLVAKRNSRRSNLHGCARPGARTMVDDRCCPAGRGRVRREQLLWRPEVDARVFRPLGAGGAAGRSNLPRVVPAFPGGPQRAGPGTALHRTKHRGNPLRLRVGPGRSGPVSRSRAAGFSSYPGQPGNRGQHPALGRPAIARCIQPAPIHRAILPVLEHRLGPLPGGRAYPPGTDRSQRVGH